jgi:hypothetical protein
MNCSRQCVMIKTMRLIRVMEWNITSFGIGGILPRLRLFLLFEAIQINLFCGCFKK